MNEEDNTLLESFLHATVPECHDMSEEQLKETAMSMMTDAWEEANGKLEDRIKELEAANARLVEECGFYDRARQSWMDAAMSNWEKVKRLQTELTEAHMNLSKRVP